MNELMVKLENVNKVYSSSSGDVIALNNINLDVHVGELVAIVGKSGSGKTTLLNVMSGWDQPTSGNVILDDVNLSEITNQESLSIRRNKIGIVFQTFGLLSLLSAYENVELQLRIAGIKDPERDSYTKDALEQVGLGSRATHRPDELSGGEQQRVSIARAIAKKPKILFVAHALLILLANSHAKGGLLYDFLQWKFYHQNLHKPENRLSNFLEVSQ